MQVKRNHSLILPAGFYKLSLLFCPLPGAHSVLKLLHDICAAEQTRPVMCVWCYTRLVINTLCLIVIFAQSQSFEVCMELHEAGNK